MSRRLLPRCRLLAIGTMLSLGLLRAAAPAMDAIAESYVKLSLAAGVHDADFVDAYFGPPEWRTAAERAKRPIAAIREEARALGAQLAALDLAGADETVRLRHEYLVRQLAAMDARLAYVGGEKRSFDEESRRWFDAVAPVNSVEHYEKTLAELDRALPGPGTVTERVTAFRNRFIIPPDRLEAVFTAAITEARRRTRAHIALPEGESFTVEYVDHKPWAGYNWYQGRYHSLIQVNTDFPIFIDRAIDLAAHEGYPGHHVYNALLEKSLVRDRGWIEYSVYPLFSPQSLIAEGSANYGVDVAFSGEERIKFERDVLFPLAGLDPARAAEYYRVQDLTKELAFAGNEAARRYIDGEIDAATAQAWLERYTLKDAARAQQALRFIVQYRSYVINYNYGQKLVHDYVEARAHGDAEKRWAEFTALISSPRLPSGLKE